VKSDVVLPKTMLETLARTNPNTLEELHHLLKDYPNRIERFAQSIIQVLSQV